LEKAIPYDDELCCVALPYGLASILYSDDDDEFKAQDFRARFISALKDTQKVAEEETRDCYA
jgi:hypothetical protein